VANLYPDVVHEIGKQELVDLFRWIEVLVEPPASSTKSFGLVGEFFVFQF